MVTNMRFTCFMEIKTFSYLSISDTVLFVVMGGRDVRHYFLVNVRSLYVHSFIVDSWKKIIKCCCILSIHTVPYIKEETLHLCTFS